MGKEGKNIPEINYAIETENLSTKICTAEIKWKRLNIILPSLIYNKTWLQYNPEYNNSAIRI